MARSLPRQLLGPPGFLLPRGSRATSLREAQRLVQNGAQGTWSHPPYAPQDNNLSSWPLAPVWPPGSCVSALMGGGSWCGCLFLIYIFGSRAGIATLPPRTGSVWTGSPRVHAGRTAGPSCSQCLRLWEQGSHQHHSQGDPSNRPLVKVDQEDGVPLDSGVLLSREKERGPDAGGSGLSHGLKRHAV